MARDMEERIRQRAYELWDNEGRPDGSADRHYAQAADELTGDDEHETLEDLIDEDDRKDDKHENSADCQRMEPMFESGRVDF